MKGILYFLTLILLFSCKENSKNNQQYVFNQPEYITIDTTMAYFSFIKKYVQENKKKLRKSNYYIMSIYDNNDNGLRIKFTATTHYNAFNGRTPLHFFRFLEDTIFVFTGLDMITKVDSPYKKKIENCRSTGSSTCI